jgi:hypothetical protein
MLTLIGGRWQRRGATWWCLGLGITPSWGGGGSSAPPAKAMSSAAPGGYGGPPLPNGGAWEALLQLGIGGGKAEAVGRFFLVDKMIIGEGVYIGESTQL